MARGYYFRGPRANEGWQLLESKEAKRSRGFGWYTFRKTLLAARGSACEVCGKTECVLELHHILKIRTHRHLRFEQSNILVVCQPCHANLEASGDKTSNAGVRLGDSEFSPLSSPINSENQKTQTSGGVGGRNE